MTYAATNPPAGLTYPEYADYQRTTSAQIPWFPSRATTAVRAS
jgi:hypothetical protein